MSALADRGHPNTLEALEHRSATIRHAARTLYRDPVWIGEIRTGDWLRKVHYLSEATIMEWLERSGINPWRPVCELRGDQRKRLIGCMLDFVKRGEG